MQEEKKEKIVRLAQYGGGSAKIEGLTADEDTLFQGVVLGHQWMTVGPDGRMRFSSVRQELPAPAADAEMLPFWRLPTPAEKVATQIKLFELGEEERKYYSTSFMIQSLCGYYYTPENYKMEAEKLESYGFLCLRSRRGEDGRFWEIWHLSGVWAARGDLRDALPEGKATELDRAEAARRFLCRYVRFGTLDMVIQRAAMTIE